MSPFLKHQLDGDHEGRPGIPVNRYHQIPVAVVQHGGVVGEVGIGSVLWGRGWNGLASISMGHDRGALDEMMPERRS